MYRYGTMQFMHIICFLALVPAVGYLYAPMFHRLRIASSFEVKKKQHIFAYFVIIFFLINTIYTLLFIVKVFGAEI
jgi:hypothetical protein